MADNYDRGDAAAKLPEELRERLWKRPRISSIYFGAEACYRALLEAGPEWEFSELEPVPHEHSHSLYVRCLDCQTFGINLPTPFAQAAECGNCKSVRTVKYYPACCMFAAAAWKFEQDQAAPAAQKAELQNCGQEIDRYMRERDEARAALAAQKAECEDLMFKRIQQAAEIGRLKAECERLREQRGIVVRAACKGADHEVELEAEVARLRSANNFLELACKKALDGLPHGRRKGIVSDFLSKAREALQGGKP